MKIKSITMAILLSISGLSANEDCIMAEELAVEFKNDTTAYMNKKQEMNKIKKFQKFVKDTGLYVLIEGHTNNLFTAEYNKELSTKRATKVMNELVRMGLKKSQVRAMGFGESSPLYDNNTKEGLAKNRRVIAEIFNSSSELDQYIKEQKARIQPIINKEQ